MVRMVIGGVLTVVVILLSACASPPPEPTVFAELETGPPSPSPTAPYGPPTVEPDVVGILNGDRDLEIGCAWLREESGHRWEILWPPGYRIEFPSKLPVLIGPQGDVVARAGDVVGVTGGSSTQFGSFCMVGEVFEAESVVVPRTDPADGNAPPAKG